MSGDSKGYDERLQSMLESGDVPDDVTAIAEALESSDDEPAGAEAAAATAAAKPDEATAAGSEDAGKSDDTAKPEAGAATPGASEPTPAADEEAAKSVVKTRDGKHEIPYSVLESERQSRRDAERRLQELEAERAKEREEQRSLESRLKALETRTQTTAEQAGLTDEEAKPGKDAAHPYAHLRGEYPDELVDALETQHQTNEELRSQIAELSARAAQERQADEDAARNDVQAAIDANDTLRGWQRDKDSPMWDAAVAVDNRLRADPAWADKPIAERLDKVVEILNGKPAELNPKPTKQPSNADTDARVDAALAEAGAAGPRTHSDLPAGQPAAQSEQAAVEQLTQHQLAQKFDGMTPEQMDEYLARYG